MKKTEDIIGRVFGLLTVKEVTDEKSPDGRTLYLCRCDCEEGNTVKVTANRLLSGSVKSCGCLRAAAKKAIGGSKERRPQGWTPEDEAERVKTIYSNFDAQPPESYDTGETDGAGKTHAQHSRVHGVYKKGNSYIAQMRIGGRTYHIISSVEEKVAINSRHEVVRVRLEQGADAAIAFIEAQKAVRKAESQKLREQSGVIQIHTQATHRK
ncbi:MAG: hypothetical protein IJD81_05875 [Oscillospiraceae bacterium]|nr:hypothetical protein [Oscillospiraceae bacterium]